MPALTFITPQVLTTTNDATWRSIDVSAFVTNASGVLLRTTYSGSTSADDHSFRKNGSTDTHTCKHAAFRHYTYHAIGVDAGNVFQYLLNESVPAGAIPTLELVGYFNSADVVFFTNSLTQGAPGNAWATWDISGATGADTAIAAILWLQNSRTTNDTTVGYRPTGSTDNPTFTMQIGRGHGVAIVGVNESEQFDVFSNSTFFGNFHCVGYIKAGYVSEDPAVTSSVGTINTWEAQSAPANAYGVFSDIVGGAASAQYGIDDSGHPEALLGITSTTASTALVPATAGIYDVQADNLATTFARRGYFADVAAPSGYKPLLQRSTVGNKLYDGTIL